MAEPLGPFDGINLESMGGNRSAKWSRIPDGVLPAWTAEMDVNAAPAIGEAIARAVHRSDFGYAGDPTETIDAFASFAADTWGWEAAGSGLIRTFPDVGAAAKETLRVLIGAGDPVIVNPPVYLSFYPWLSSIGGTALEVPMLDVASGGRLDLAGMQRAFESGAKVALLCSPHNPLGYVSPAEELAELADLADAHDAVVISDEIHAPLVHPDSAQQFVPFLTVSDAARRVGIALHSPSKAWNTAGLKLAYAVVADRSRWPARLGEFDWQPSILGQYAAIAAYAEGRDWLAVTVRQIQERAAQLGGLLAEEIPAIGYYPPKAGYLAWLDCRDLGLGDNPAKTFLSQGKVMLSPGPAFGAGGAGFARLNIGTSRELMTEAVHRMRAALD